MEYDSFAVRTAIFCLLGVLLLGASWSLLTSERGDHRNYLVVTNETVSGLAKQSGVYYKGVEAGTVEDIFFQNNNFDRVHIRIRIDDSIPVARNTFAQLALRGITGEYDLRLDNDGPVGEPLESSEESPGIIPMKPEYMAQLGSSFELMLSDISEASDGLAQLLAPPNRNEVNRLLTNLADTAESVGEASQALTPAIVRLGPLLNELENTLAEFRQLASNMDAHTINASAAIDNVSRAAQSVNSLGNTLETDTAQSVTASMKSLESASAELQALLEELRQDPQRLLLGAPAAALGPGEQSARTAQ